VDEYTMHQRVELIHFYDSGGQERERRKMNLEFSKGEVLRWQEL
jgi:hypothetical protein